MKVVTEEDDKNDYDDNDDEDDEPIADTPENKHKGKRRSYDPNLKSYKKTKWDEGCKDDDDNGDGGFGAGQPQPAQVPIAV